MVEVATTSKSQDTVNLRFSGNQGTDHFFPLLPKSVVAIWQFFHGKHKEHGEKAIVIQATVIQAIEIERQQKTGGDWALRTDQQRQGTRDRLTGAERLTDSD